MQAEILRKIRHTALGSALVPLASLACAQGASVGAPAARVDAKVTQTETGYKYEFAVINSSPTQSGKASPYQLVSWELPLYSDKDISNVVAPAGWAYEIVAVEGVGRSYNVPDNAFGHFRWDYNPAADPLIDPVKGNATMYGSAPQVFAKPKFVLHFYTVSDGPGNPADPVKSFVPRSGFSFISPYNGAPAPYRTFWTGQKPRGGDRPLKARIAQIPSSPAFQEAMARASK